MIEKTIIILMLAVISYCTFKIRQVKNETEIKIDEIHKKLIK